MPNLDEDSQLENEAKHGHHAEHVYEAFVKPFLDAKRKILFQAFNDLPISATDDLKEIKRMGQTLDAFEIEIQNFIDTGKLATRAISESMPKDGEKH